MQGLALMVQQHLGRDPFAGDLWVFRGRTGSLIKIAWHDGIDWRNPQYSWRPASAG
jgi:transposase